MIYLDKYVLFLTLQKFCYCVFGKKNLSLVNHVRESILPGSSLLRSEKKKGSLRSLVNKGLTFLLRNVNLKDSRGVVSSIHCGSNTRCV